MLSSAICAREWANFMVTAWDRRRGSTITQWALPTDPLPNTDLGLFTLFQARLQQIEGRFGERPHVRLAVPLAVSTVMERSTGPVTAMQACPAESP